MLWANIGCYYIVLLLSEQIAWVYSIAKGPLLVLIVLPGSKFPHYLFDEFLGPLINHNMHYIEEIEKKAGEYMDKGKDMVQGEVMGKLTEKLVS